ncbi:hypothetical protein [Roseicitreum antarcticum]|uniref:Uncharacterized protein n=1 Tax=Roseicitreum antarcticum TaxID=564137 RepID=A0A1H2R346_9RHOB|nr:hypothetical protein [Roseicitreum antarcticum]SDW13765.1 hypothetical protein SAMN04488238_101177 [Roseicitreum antarcticum]
MILKIVTFFLLFMVVMGAIQKFLFPHRRNMPDLLKRPRKCAQCGRFSIGRGKCACKS